MNQSSHDRVEQAADQRKGFGFVEVLFNLILTQRFNLHFSGGFLGPKEASS